MDRPYQTRLFDEVRKAIGMGKRKILIVLPTGAGKGRCAARVMEMATAKGTTSAFFAEQRELIYQIEKHLGGFNIPSNIIMAGVKNEYASASHADLADMNYLIAKNTLWSRAFRSKKMEIPNVGMVHIDECHQSLSQTYIAIQEAYKHSIILGWTATPCRTDNKPLGAIYNHMVQAATYKELQDGGFLVPVRVIAPTSPNLKGCKASNGDYQKADLEKRMNRDEMVGDIVQEWMRHTQDRSTVVFAAGVQHSIHIRNEFRRYGIVAEHIDGNMPEKERDDIIEEARNGSVRVVCNYGVATTGIDIPAWKYMICARPTKSFGLWRQMGGRIQRPYHGHDHCFIQDHSDNSLVFGYPDEDVEWEIDGDESIAEKHRKKKAREKGDDGKEKGDIFKCDQCHTPYRGPHCPACGYRSERKGKEIEMKKGELKELERKRANKEATQMDKQKYWDKCLGWAIANDRKVGAASHRYRDKFGVWPNRDINNVPVSCQYQMTGKEFYHSVILPAKQALSKELQQEFGF